LARLSPPTGSGTALTLRGTAGDHLAESVFFYFKNMPSDNLIANVNNSYSNLVASVTAGQDEAVA